MPWNVTNRQLDPMSFTLDDGTVVAAAGGAVVAVNSGVRTIVYHGLGYQRNGIWPFPANQNVNASYGGANAPNNCYIINPNTAVTAVYPYRAP